MIVITPLDGSPAEYFENYNDLFTYLIENKKLNAANSSFQEMKWSFTIYPPSQVAAFYAHLKDTNEAIKEAYEEGLSLIEICAGDYNNPTYIALTLNIDLDYLKKKWCVDYCTWNHFVVKEV